jgi:hypothetical protein
LGGREDKKLKIKFSNLPTQTFTGKAAAVGLAGVVVGYMASGAGGDRQEPEPQLCRDGHRLDLVREVAVHRGLLLLPGRIIQELLVALALLEYYLYHFNSKV